MDLVSLPDIRAAQHRIAGVAVRTPLIPAGWADDSDRRLYMKPEMLQPIGAFKIRGAYNKIARLTPEERARGVIGSSSGNHAQALAFAAARFGSKATVVMPETAPAHKVDATRLLGASVIIVPPSERDVVPAELAAEHGYVLVPPYDDPDIIAGQGTAGVEIAEDLPDVDLVLVPVSGGGLISGIATAVKALRPAARIVGVEPSLAGDAAESFQRGERQVWEPARTHRTIADGLRTTSVGVLPWRHIQAYVDDIITVTDDQIRQAMREVVLQSRLVVEPSGAVAAAAYLFGRDRLPNAARTVAVLSGGNVSPALLAEILINPGVRGQAGAAG